MSEPRNMDLGRWARGILVLGALLLGFVVLHALWFGLTRDLTKVYVLSTGQTLQPGSPAASYPSAREGGANRPFAATLKVMSYNLNHASRGDNNAPQNDPYFPRGLEEWEKIGLSMYSLLKNPGRLDKNLDNIIAAIKAEDPDIVYLQEADRDMPESFGVDTAGIIARGAGFPYAVWGSKWSMDLGVKFITGNAILSKYPIVEAENVPLNPIDGWSFYRQFLGVHTALVATVEVEGALVELINTHLYSKKYGYAKKAEQVRSLLSLVQESPHPVILGGDFNTSFDRLASHRPCAKDPTLPALIRSSLVSAQGFDDRESLDFLLLRPGDRTRYLQRFKRFTNTTDHQILVSVVGADLPEGSRQEHRGLLAGQDLSLAATR